MIQLKLSKYLSVLWLQSFQRTTTDFLLYSLRTKGLLRVSEEFMNRIKAGDFLTLPEPLIVFLLKFEMLIPSDLNEEISLEKRRNALHLDGKPSPAEQDNKLTDEELLDYSRALSLVNF